MALTLALTLALTGSLALGACGSDSATGTKATAGSGTGSGADCFDGTLKAEGSSAQKNAIEAARERPSTTTRRAPGRV